MQLQETIGGSCGGNGGGGSRGSVSTSSLETKTLLEIHSI
jgi:hypothetical protein